ncbi:hypothetical protein Aperf_G00000105282 [Anoplocephala perfoliata]
MNFGLQNSTSIRNNIAFLEIEVVNCISEYLNDTEFSNARKAIPGWNEILAVKEKMRKVMHFTWLDQKLYTMLFKNSPSISFADAEEAIEYHSTHKQLSFPEQPIRANYQNGGHLEILFITPEISPKDSDRWRVKFDLFYATPGLGGILRGRIHQVGIKSITLPSMLFVSDDDELEKTPLEVAKRQTDLAGLSQLYRKHIHMHDVIIYFVDYSNLIVETLQFILRALSSRHILIIAVVPGARNTAMKEMCYLRKLICAIGGFIDSELKNSSIQWRLWCVRRDSRNKPDLTELAEWLPAFEKASNA